MTTENAHGIHRWTGPAVHCGAKRSTISQGLSEDAGDAVQIALTSDDLRVQGLLPKGKAAWHGKLRTCRARDVRRSGTIRRVSDMANEWPILVRVTTANAMVLGTVDPQQKTDDGSS